ncbi:DUF6473 family protein [uncultured Jannaschia sp.]|uniref:DUF6473 family protein n=1 Tax=uncultured Jannaschia sp. TaxID=293347 RepID=UPI0026388A48|nr:DUF6473 family protein [uncultured Jannaschia sp.]
MTYEGRDTELDYHPCCYGSSRTIFRGPAVPLDKPYTVVVGGSEIYGRYVVAPATEQLAERTGRRVVNLGVQNAGIDAFYQDDDLMQVIEGAETVVLQALGAANMSNRFYTVHRRRNDRFLKRSVAMDNLYPKVDFSEFSFTRHMLLTLCDLSPEKFDIVRDELSTAWVARMRALLERAPGRRILLSIEDRRDLGLGPEPLFVTADMLNALSDSVDGIVRCDVTQDFLDADTTGMVFPDLEEEVARQCLTPAAHARIAEAVADVLCRPDSLTV